MADENNSWYVWSEDGTKILLCLLYKKRITDILKGKNDKILEEMQFFLLVVRNSHVPQSSVFFATQFNRNPQFTFLSFSNIRFTFSGNVAAHREGDALD